MIYDNNYDEIPYTSGPQQHNPQIPNEVKPLDVQVGGTHYKKYKIQPVEFCHVNKIGPIESAAIWYLCRWRNKNGIEDLEKAKHFIDILIQLETEGK
jgi:hypothetical protein